MGRLLASLLANTESAPAANPANPANRTPSSGRKFADSQDSQGPAIEKTLEQRAHLLTLAADELLPAGLVHGLADADVSACAGLSDSALRAYLRALNCGRRMDAGMVPVEWGEPVTVTCEGCGPVLLWSTCPAVVKACPWCFCRKAGKAIPRPAVRCGDCRHHLPNKVNPAAGTGTCGVGARWQVQEHRCTDWRASDE